MSRLTLYLGPGLPAAVGRLELVLRAEQRPAESPLDNGPTADPRDIRPESNEALGWVMRSAARGALAGADIVLSETVMAACAPERWQRLLNITTRAGWLRPAPVPGAHLLPNSDTFIGTRIPATFPRPASSTDRVQHVGCGSGGAAASPPATTGRGGSGAVTITPF